MYYRIHIFTGFRIQEFTGSLTPDSESDSGFGFRIWLLIRKYNYQIKSKLHRKNTLFTKMIVHIYQHIICLCSGFNFSPDFGFRIIPDSQNLSEFQISGIPVASLFLSLYPNGSQKCGPRSRIRTTEGQGGLQRTTGKSKIKSPRILEVLLNVDPRTKSLSTPVGQGLLSNLHGKD